MHPLLHFNCRQLEVQDLFAGQEQQVLSAVVSQPKTVLLTRTFSHEIDKWTLGTRLRLQLLSPDSLPPAYVHRGVCVIFI